MREPNFYELLEIEAYNNYLNTPTVWTLMQALGPRPYLVIEYPDGYEIIEKSRENGK